MIAPEFDNGVYLGGGLVQHTGTKLDGDGSFRDIDFDDATGFTIQTGHESWVDRHSVLTQLSAPQLCELPGAEPHTPLGRAVARSLRQSHGL